MIRIGIDARFLLSKLRGIPLYVARICELLPSLNYNYQFYYFINRAFEHNDNYTSYQPLLNKLSNSYSNVNIINCNHEAQIKWEQIYIPLLIKKYNINLLHMPGNRICFSAKIPVITTIHDIIEYTSLNQQYIRNTITKSSGLKMMIYNMRVAAYIWSIYKLANNKTARIITVSRHSSNDIVNLLGVPPNKVSVIYHGIDHEFIIDDEDINTIITRKMYSTTPKYVLMLGGDSPHKNVEGAISAWAKVPEEIRRQYPLKVIGFCGNAESPLIRTLHKYKLENEVEVKGWVRQDELIEYFRNATLFLYLSHYEGFGFPVLHAMASGTPVISSNTSSLPEVLGEVGLRFDPNDHIGIANGIETLLSNANLRANQCIAGINRARDFSWERSAKEHLKVYESVLENQHGTFI